MTLDYDILFAVFFRHTYFASSKLECVSVTPDKNSLQIMKNHGLLFKSFNDGFRVLYETTQAGRKRDRRALLNENLKLRFTLDLSDTSFYNYTSVAADNIKDFVFYFGNTPLNNAAPGTLHQDEFVSEKDLLSVEATGENFFVKPFGLLNIELSANLAEENTIRFDKKASYWQYIVSSDHLKSLNNPAILNADNQAVFSNPEKIELPDKREALLFTSLAPINLAEKPAELFQLVENYESGSGKHKVVKKALPVPDVKSVSSGSGKNKTEKKNNYSEIFIY